MPFHRKLFGFSGVLAVTAACGGPDEIPVAVLPVEPPIALAKPPGPPGQAPNSSASATLAIVSDGVQPVLGSERATTVTLQNNITNHGGFSASFNFQTTYSAWRDAVSQGVGPCKYSGSSTQIRRDSLFAKLIDPTFRVRSFYLTVDKTALGGASADHSWNHTWNEAAGDSLFTAGITTASQNFPGVYPTVIEPSPYEYHFTGGVVQIRDRSGRNNTFFFIFCPNLDEAVVTWTPPAP